jgi:predicted nucleic acid-binding protein
MATADAVFVDAGLFIGALLGDDPRHAEARPLVESARRGEISWCHQRAFSRRFTRHSPGLARNPLKRPIRRRRPYDCS